MKIQIRHLMLLARILIGGLFIYASAHKILNPADFAVSIRNYMILPLGWTNIVAITLPWIELGAGILLLVGVLTRPSALLITSMLLVFLLAMVNAYWMGLDIECGCFSSPGQSSGKIGPLYFLRDVSLFLTSAFILFFDKGDFSLARR